MRNEEWITLFKSIPEQLQAQLVLQLINGTEVCFDTIVHYNPDYLVVRARLGGTTDEGRGFFIPYDQMLLLRWERLVKLGDLQELAGLTRSATTSVLELEAEQREAAESGRTIPAIQSPVVTPKLEALPTNPAATGIDTKTILEKIRAMRAGNSPGGGAKPTGN